MTNRNVLIKLRKTPSTSSGKLCALCTQLSHLDPIILSQNAEHIHSILNEENTLGLDDKLIEEDISNMGRIANSGRMEPLVTSFIDILKKIDSRATKIEQLPEAKEEELEI